MKPLIYLSGPIANCTKEEIHEWREEFKDLYGAEFCCDPARQVVTEKFWENADKIVERDLADIEKCQVHLVYYTRPTCGTLMETVHAHYMGKMIMVVCPNEETYKNLSPWIIYHSDAVVRDFGEAITLIEEMFRNAEETV